MRVLGKAKSLHLREVLDADALDNTTLMKSSLDPALATSLLRLGGQMDGRDGYCSMTVVIWNLAIIDLGPLVIETNRAFLVVPLGTEASRLSRDWKGLPGLSFMPPRLTVLACAKTGALFSGLKLDVWFLADLAGFFLAEARSAALILHETVFAGVLLPCFFFVRIAVGMPVAASASRGTSRTA
jgi:hypothetical protein